MNDPCPFLPFALPDIGDDEIAEVVDTLRSGWVTTGPKAARFEHDFRAFLGDPLGEDGLHAIAVNSATAGLHLALEGLCIGPGDMSVSMGHRGNRSAPEVEAGVKRVLAAAKKHNKWVSLPASDAASAKRCLEMGANIVQFPANYFVLHYGKTFLRDVGAA